MVKSFPINSLQGILGIFLISLFVFVSCDNSVSPKPEAGSDEPLFVRTNNLNDRITIFDQKEQNLFRVNKKYLEHIKSGVKRESAMNLQITKVMTVDPPPQGSFSQIAASHLSWDEDQEQVYVAYIVAGAEFGGGFDVLDANIACYKNNNSTCRDASFITNQFEVGAVTTTSDFFYASGSANSESSNSVNGIDLGTFDSNAAIFRTPIDNIDGNGTIEYADLASFSATDVKTNNGNVYVTTGDEGGKLYKLNADLTESASVEPGNADLRSMALSDSDLFLLNGDGKINKTSLSSQSLNLTSVGDAGSGIRDFTIAKMSYGENNGGRLYVPLNDGGFSVVDAASGNVISQIQSNYFSSITVGNDFVYAAGSNDSDKGLVQVYEWDTTNQNLVEIGNISIDGVQANLIKAVDDYLFVANDEKGVMVLEISK